MHRTRTDLKSSLSLACSALRLDKVLLSILRLSFSASMASLALSKASWSSFRLEDIDWKDIKEIIAQIGVAQFIPLICRNKHSTLQVAFKCYLEITTVKRDYSGILYFIKHITCSLLYCHKFAKVGHYIFHYL